MTAADEPVKTCGICGVELKDPKTADPLDPRVDTGGECQVCASYYEDELEAR